MTTLVIPDTVQIAASMTCSGQSVVNVLHFKYPTGTLLDLNATLGAFRTAWEKAAGPLKLRSSAVTMVGYHATDLNSATGGVASLASSTAGGGASTLSTMASSALVKFSGGTRSRRSSGRLYHGPLIESDINTDGRTLATATATAINLAYTTLKADMLAINLELVVASRKYSDKFSVLDISTAGIIATQRRRQR